MNIDYDVLIKKLSFTFSSDKTPFFHNINLCFPAGKVTFVQGKNGIGKSTLFRILQGTIDIHEQISGTIIVNKTPYDLSKKEVIPCIRVVEQHFVQMIADQFSGRENMQLALLTRYPSLNYLSTDTTFESFAQQAGIDLIKPMHLLSGGQKQIMAIIMILQKPTRVLLLDEPTATLDTENAQLVIAFLTQLAQHMHLVIIIISHDNSLLEKYASHGHYSLHINNETQERVFTYCTPTYLT